MEEQNKSSDEQASIYDDLVYQGDLGLVIHNLQNKNKQLNSHVISLEDDIQKLCNKISEMKKIQDTLSRNISELFKTAKCEIERKDRLISELQTKVDEMIFRRNTSKSNFSLKRQYDEPVENIVKRSKYDSSDGANSKIDVYSSERSVKSSNRSDKSDVLSEKFSKHRSEQRSSSDDNRRLSSKYDSTRRRSKSREKEHRRREPENDRKRLDDREKRGSRSKEHNQHGNYSRHRNDKYVDKKSSHKDKQSLHDDSHTKLCISSNKSSKSSSERKNLKPDDVSESKKIASTKITVQSEIVKVKTTESGQTAIHSKPTEIQKNSTESSVRPECIIILKHAEKDNSTSLNSDQSKIDLNESKEEGEISDDLEKETKNDRISSLRKSTLASRNASPKIEPKIETLKKDRSKPSRLCIEKGKSDSIKKHEFSHYSKDLTKQTENVEEKIDKKENQRRKEKFEAEKIDKYENQSRRDKSGPEKMDINVNQSEKEKLKIEIRKSSSDNPVKDETKNSDNSENVTILSHIVLHKAEDTSQLIIKSQKEVSNSDTTRCEIKVEDTAKRQLLTRVNPPSSGVPRNLTNELDINLSKSKEIEISARQKISSLFDTPIKAEIDVKKSMVCDLQLTHEGDIPSILDLEVNNSKEETSTPEIVEFRIFKSNLVNADISTKALQVQDEVQEKDKMKTKLQENLPKQMVKNENIGYGNTVDMNNFSMDLLNAHFGSYKPEDYPNLTVHTEEKNEELIKTVEKKIDSEIISKESSSINNKSKDESLNTSNEQGSSVEIKRKRRRCIIKWSD